MKVTTANNSAEYAQVAQFAAIGNSGKMLRMEVFFGLLPFVHRTKALQAPTSPCSKTLTSSALRTEARSTFRILYNGKDKTFYFLATAAPAIVQAPAAIFPSHKAFRQGDFSSLLGSLLSSILLPATHSPAINSETVLARFRRPWRI